MRLYLFLFIVALSTTGCASLGTYNTATGRSELIAISTSQEIQMGSDIHRDILRNYKVSTDAVKTRRLLELGERLAQVSDRQDLPYHFILIDKDELNAFTVPGGSIYFFTGLFDKLKTDDQIASVLAHEIGHCAAKHTIKKFQAAAGYSMASNIIFNYLGIGQNVKQVTQIGSNLAMNLIFSAYGRQDEYEADRLGVKYMYLAGFNLDGMVESFQVLEESSKDKSGPPLILRSHPFINDRIVKVKQEIESAGRKYGGQ